MFNQSVVNLSQFKHIKTMEVLQDCQVLIAHDCNFGNGTMIAACAEISGNVCIGPGAFIGPNTSISNGLNVSTGTSATIGAVATRNVPDNVKVSGNFAI